MTADEHISSYSLTTLETERLVLKGITPGIYHLLFRNGGEAEIMKTLYLADAGELAAERLKYEQGITSYNRSFINFLMIDRASGSLVGKCGFHNWYVQHHRAELGYAMMSDAYKGRGYMTEALAAVVDYGFNDLGLHRIEALISPANVPSLRLVRKLGFQQEGLLREHYLIHGRYEDSAMYALLKGDYTALPGV